MKVKCVTAVLAVLSDSGSCVTKLLVVLLLVVLSGNVSHKPEKDDRGPTMVARGVVIALEDTGCSFL